MMTDEKHNWYFVENYINGEIKIFSNWDNAFAYIEDTDESIKFNLSEPESFYN